MPCFSGSLPRPASNHHEHISFHAEARSVEDAATGIRTASVMRCLLQGTCSLCVRASQIYRDKIAADAVDDANDNDRQTVPQYVYDWFLNKYGLWKLAEQQLAKMFGTTLRYAIVYQARCVQKRYLT